MCDRDVLHLCFAVVNDCAGISETTTRGQEDHERLLTRESLGEGKVVPSFRVTFQLTPASGKLSSLAFTYSSKQVMGYRHRGSGGTCWDTNVSMNLCVGKVVEISGQRYKTLFGGTSLSCIAHQLVQFLLPEPHLYFRRKEFLDERTSTLSTRSDLTDHVICSVTNNTHPT